MNNDKQKKRIEKLKEQIFQLEHDKDLLRQDNEALRQENETLLTELAEVRASTNDYIEELERQIQAVKNIKAKYKKLISSVRKKKQAYSNEMKEVIKEFKKEID